MAPKPLAPARAGASAKNTGALAPAKAKQADGGSSGSSLDEIRNLLQVQMEKQAEMFALQKGGKTNKGSKTQKDHGQGSSYGGRQREGDKIVASKWNKMAVWDLAL